MWLTQLVHDARIDRGWSAIAQALAISPDEARLRFDPEPRIADGRAAFTTTEPVTPTSLQRSAVTLIGTLDQPATFAIATRRTRVRSSW